MLYVLVGEDFGKRAKKLEEIIFSFRAKSPDLSFTKLTSENFSGNVLDELLQGQGLFVKKCVVVLDGLFESKEIKEIILGKLKEISVSENIFIINERAVGAGDLTKLKVKSEKIQEFEIKEKIGKAKFNIFSLADAVGNRDKKTAWVVYLRALENGSEPEEIHGTIFWQVKNMLLLKNTERPTAESTGLKPFVLSKAKSFSNNYSAEELGNFSSRLVSLYHDSHRGIGAFSVGLEKLILETL